MTNTKAMKNIEDMTLENIIGGNYGDSKWEYEHDCNMYNIGDVVEVFTNDFHIYTKRSLIIDIRTDIPAWNTKYFYVVEYMDWTGRQRTVSADYIERK